MFILRSSVVSGLTVLFFYTLSTTALAAVISGTSVTGNNGGGATTLTINKPTSLISGDLLLASITYDKGANTTISSPTGWTPIRATNNGLNVGIATYYKFAGASEPSSYNWTISPSRTAVGGIVVYTGVEPINPIDTTSDASGHSSSASAPSIITTEANEVIVAVFGIDDNRTFSTPTGFTEKFDVSNPSKNGPATSFNNVTQVSAGIVATSTSAVGTPNRRWVAQHIVLHPRPPMGTLRVAKTVINDNVGTSTASAFSFRIDGGDITPFNANGINDFLLPPGTYSVVETSANGYAGTYSNCSSASVSNGATTTCTITNNDIPGALLTVRKVVEGGPAVPSDFTLSVGSTTVQSGQQNFFPTGTYRVSEQGPSGYRSVIGGDCDASGDVTLGSNGVKTCTIISYVLENTLALCTDNIDNDQDSITDLFDSDCDPFIPRLTVVSSSINDNGGTFDGNLSQMDFLVPNPSNPLPGTVRQNTSYTDRYRTPSGPPITLKLNPGAYELVWFYRGGYPDLTSEYALTQSQDCATTIAPGEHRTCTLTFDDNAPRLTVIKHVQNNNGGTAVAGDFTMNVTGTNVSDPSFGGDESGNTITLDPGAYSVTEANQSGYTVLTGTNCSGTINLGEARTCVITNTDIPPALILVNQVVNDNGGTATTTDWTLSASGLTPISGAGFVTSETTNNFTAGTYTLSESGGPSGYTSSSWSCSGDVANSGNSITLGIGQNSTCTIINNDN
jgi:hypothetical protein